MMCAEEAGSTLPASSPAAIKGKRPNPSPSPEGTIVHDLLTEILSRLPVKSLLQLRCVSKPWHSLIGDKINRKKLQPAMVGLFNKLPNMEFTGLKSRTYVDPSSFDAAVSFLPSPSRGRRHIFDCSNGLLVLSDYVRQSPHMYICNPATQMWAQIPKPSPGLFTLALAFDPASRNSSRPHYKYKIFCSLLDPRDEEFHHVFSSETGEWRKFQHDGPASDRDTHFLRAPDTDSVFLNGVIYAANVKSDFVLAVDLERNLCKRIQLAEVVSRVPYSSWRYLSIGCSRGLLHIAVVGEAEDLMFVFVLEEGDGHGVGVFVLKHEIRGLQAAVRMKFAAAAAAGGGFHSEVDFVRDMRVISFHQFLELIFLRLGPLIISYHLVSGQLEEINSIQETRERLFTWFPYTPCFLGDLDFLKY